MKKYLIFLIPLLWIGCQTAVDEEAVAREIQQILDTQTQAWNAGDFRAFMEPYWNSEEMTFQSGNNRLYGWQALLTRYETTYAGEKMGTLTFKDLEIKVLSRDLAYVLGRYHLAYPDSSLEGVYTILLKRFPEGWLIIHDHSSS
jgi:beta-aspartyl-peptidase (threonine type)